MLVSKAPVAAAASKHAVAPVGERVKKPEVSHEKSRSQYLCRTGVKGPGQNFAMPCGKDKKFATAAAACAAAEKWLPK